MSRRKSLLVPVLATMLSATPAFADDEGYIDNWTGSFKLEAQIGSAAPVALPGDRLPSSFSKRFHEAWANRRSTLCSRIQQKLRDRGQLSKWISCSIPEIGELRAKSPNASLFPNQLELKYVVVGNRIQFEAPTPTPLGSAFDPVLTGYFTVELRLTLVFDRTLDGSKLEPGFEVPDAGADAPDAPYLQGPVVATSAIMRFSSAKFTSDWEVIPGPDLFIMPHLRQAEAEFNATSESLLSEGQDVFGLRDVNIQFYEGAHQIRDLIEHFSPEDGTPTARYFLTTSISGQEYVVRLYRPNPPLPLPGCGCTAACDNRVSCTCQGASLYQEGNRFVLQRQMPGGVWQTAGHSDIWSITGSALGATRDELVTFRVCTTNNWGMRCGDPFSFAYGYSGSCAAPGNPGGGTRPGPAGGGCVRGPDGTLTCPR